ncbi:unnamed protein product [Rhizoctonia solani]|uniref:Uncharacterized protein n=1 Tax=Rhizoctonia solani TaxID=456999 RepID=A0A8H3DLE2_9AGAM|nr:unnamed protein product [Rhizoctonia solani]
MPPGPLHSTCGGEYMVSQSHMSQGSNQPTSNIDCTGLWLRDVIAEQDRLLSLLEYKHFCVFFSTPHIDRFARNSARQQPERHQIWTQINTILTLLEAPEALQFENQDVARSIVKEVETAIRFDDRCRGEPGGLDLLVRLHTLDGALWSENLQDLGSVLLEASLTHLNRMEQSSVSSRYHLEMALEYYARAESSDLGGNDTRVLRKLVAIGKVRLGRCIEHWEEILEGGLANGSTATDNPFAGQKLNVPEESRDDFFIGFQCISYMPGLSFTGNFTEMTDHSPEGNNHLSLPGITLSASIYDTSTWAYEVLQAQAKLQELASDGSKDTAPALAQIHLVFSLLEAFEPFTFNDHFVWATTLMASRDAFRELSGTPNLLSHYLTQAIELSVRYSTLSDDLCPRQGSKQSLVAALGDAIGVHLHQIMAPNGTTDTRLLDAVLEYYARLASIDHNVAASLDPIDQGMGVPQMVAACGILRMREVIAKSQVFETFESTFGQNCSPFDDHDIWWQYLQPDMRPLLIKCFETIQQAEADMNFVIECLSWGVRLLQEDDPELPNILDVLSFFLGFRRIIFQDHSSYAMDINQAVEYQTRAISLTPKDHPKYQERMNHLANLLEDRFNSGEESMEDVEKTLEILRSQAKDLKCEDEQAISDQIALAAAFERRFEMTGTGDDIDRAIETLSRVAQSLPVNYPPLHRATISKKLGVIYRRRFLSFGKLADIDKAVEYLGHALLFQSEGQGSRGLILLESMRTRKARYDRLKEHRDMHMMREYFEELQVSKESTGTVAHEHHIRQLFSTPLDLVDIMAKLPMSHDPDPAKIEALNEKVTFAEKLVAIFGSAPTYIAHLARCLYERYLDTNDTTDIHDAIGYMNQALSLKPQGHSDVPNWYYELACFHYIRLYQSPSLGDYQQAVQCANQALSLFPCNHRNRTSCLVALANIYCHGPSFGEDRGELQQMYWKCYQEAACCVRGDPSLKLMAAHVWVHTSMRTKNYGQAMEAFTAAMSIVPEVAWLGDTVAKRFSLGNSALTAQIGTLATKAAATAIHSHYHATALEWLEQGRSVIWNQTLQLRTPLDELQSAKPELAHELKQLSAELHHAGFQTPYTGGADTDLTSLEAAAQRHR